MTISNDALFDVLPYLAEEEYWIETEDGLAKAPAFLIIPNNNIYILFLNKVGVINRYKRLKQAQTRIKELVESGNYPMKIYLKKHGKIRPRPFAENLIRRIEPLNENTPVKAFEINEWGSISTSCIRKEAEKVN
jgi:hypothetical protein